MFSLGLSGSACYRKAQFTVGSIYMLKYGNQKSEIFFNCLHKNQKNVLSCVKSIGPIEDLIARNMETRNLKFSSTPCTKIRRMCYRV